VAKLEDVVDLLPVRGGIRWLPEELIDQRKAIHICSDLLRPAPDGARRAYAHAAKDEN